MRSRSCTLLFGGLLVLTTSAPVFAQHLPARTIDYVSPSLLSESDVRPVPDANIWKLRDRDIVATQSKKSTAGDRWEAFEREYGIREPRPSWFLRTLQSAKYQLDRLSFGAKETAKHLEFTYELGSSTGPGGTTAKPQYTVPVFGAFGHPQIRTVLTEHDPQTATPFVGVKLSVPFGAP